MLKRISLCTGFIFILTLFLGCGPNRTSEKKSKTRKSSLVNGKRNVEQIRGSLRKSRDKYKSNNLSAASRHYKASMLGRGTGMIISNKWDTDPDGFCNSYITASGSGLLSSDTRMVTARHLLSGSDENPEEGVTQPIKISFDGAYRVRKTDNRPHCRGQFIRDDKSHSDWWDDIGQEGRADTKSDVKEENPLLANRLFQLGLHTWAEDSNWTDSNGDTPSYVGRGRKKRDKLRSRWPFEIDENLAIAQEFQTPDADPDGV